MRKTIRTIYITRFVHSKLIKMFSLHYHELTGKIEENEGKTIWLLIIICYMKHKTRLKK